MLAFNWFFLPPVHTFTLGTARTGSRSPCTSRRRWSSASSPRAPGVGARGAEQREKETALLAELATELLRGGSSRRSCGVWARRRPTCSASSGRDRAGRRRGAAGQMRRIPLEADGRPSGRSTRRRGDPSLDVRPRFLPALAALLAVAVDAAAGAGGARGRDAAPQRPRQDRAAARRVPRPALAADRHPTAIGALRNPTLDLSEDDRGRVARDDRRRGRAARPARRRPARPVPARGRRRRARAPSCGRSTTSFARRWTSSGRGTASRSPARRRSCRSTPCRSSASSPT